LFLTCGCPFSWDVTKNRLVLVRPFAGSGVGAKGFASFAFLVVSFLSSVVMAVFLWSWLALLSLLHGRGGLIFRGAKDKNLQSHLFFRSPFVLLTNRLLEGGEVNAVVV